MKQNGRYIFWLSYSKKVFLELLLDLHIEQYSNTIVLKYRSHKWIDSNSTSNNLIDFYLMDND